MIGSSFISMEVVVAVAKRKLASIDVIGMENYPFEAVLGSEVGKGLMQVSHPPSNPKSIIDVLNSAYSITNRKESNSTCVQK